MHGRIPKIHRKGLRGGHFEISFQDVYLINSDSLYVLYIFYSLYVCHILLWAWYFVTFFSLVGLGSVRFISYPVLKFTSWYMLHAFHLILRIGHLPVFQIIIFLCRPFSTIFFLYPSLLENGSLKTEGWGLGKRAVLYVM